MSKESVQTIVGRAILEPEYRKLLFSDPGKAMEGYELTGEETEAIKGLDSEKFDVVANQLEERISKTGLSFSQVALKVDAPLNFNADLLRLFDKI